MFCENCGQSVADGSLSCQFCGQAFVAADVPSTAAQAARSSPGLSGQFAPSNVAQGLTERSDLLVLPVSRKALDTLERGSVIRNAVSLALRIIGVLIVIAGLYGLVQILKSSFQMPTQATMGGLIFAAAFVADIFGLVQICFHRAASISQLGDSPFPVIPVISVLFRAAGEAYAVVFATMGFGGCLFIWISGIDPMALLNGLGGFLPMVSAGGTFVDGLKFLITMVLASFGSLILFYFLAEAVLVVADIACNVRMLVKLRSDAS